jgi:GNAT superfamily N-acetyltransferase
MDYPKNVTIADGHELELRPGGKEDEERLLRFFSALPEADLLFMREDVTDASVIRRWMRHLDPERVFALLAVHRERVVGYASLHTSPHGWGKHVGEVRMVVAPEWRRKGVARAQMRELVTVADERGVVILETLILEGQHNLQHAFEALGFSAESVLRDRGCDRTGRRRNVLVMRNDVADMWRHMEDLVSDMSGGRSGEY